MKICFTGDLFLGGDLLDQDVKNIINVDIFNDADKRVVNLEQPISDNNHIEDKSTLYTGSYALEQLKQLKINAVNLAHNHIQDKGLNGISETIKHLNSISIGNFGAGTNIVEASRPYYLTDDIAVLGYCEFNKPYLNQVVVAEKNASGVNPLRKEKILKDLDLLPKGVKVILYFHWGVEHAWLPSSEDIFLAKELLEDARVLTIIGMHPHRMQGVVRHAGKEAYMCLGNFLFPNFFIAPPTQITYPNKDLLGQSKWTTKQYHSVYELTYKKWRWVNRVSIVLELCTLSNTVKYKLVKQEDDTPKVIELKGFELVFMEFFLKLLNIVYQLPDTVYKLLYKLHIFEVKSTWRIQIRLFQYRQLGFKKILSKVIKYVKKK
jgi:hypothetical protein